MVGENGTKARVLAMMAAGARRAKTRIFDGVIFGGSLIKRRMSWQEVLLFGSRRGCLDSGYVVTVGAGSFSGCKVHESFVTRCQCTTCDGTSQVVIHLIFFEKGQER